MMNACCTPCAEARERSLALVPRASRALHAGVGFVTDSDIDTFNDALTKLRADVVAATDKRRAAAGDAYLSDAAYIHVWTLEGQLTALRDEWTAYVTDHTGTLSRFSDSEFAAFKLRYSDAFAEFKALGYTTSATDVGPGSNPGDKGKNPLALTSLGVPTWIIVAAVGLAVLVIMGPAVIQILAVRRLAP